MEDWTQYLPYIIAAVLGLIEITPIKINPFGSFMKYLGKWFNKDMEEQIQKSNEEVKKQIDTLYAEMSHQTEEIRVDFGDKLSVLTKTVDGNETDRIRYEILDFANSCRNGRQHSKDEFHHIVEINEKYHKLIEKNGLTNGVLDAEYAYIERVYRECLDEGTLL